MLLALALLTSGAGTAQDAPRITQLTPGDGSRLVSPIQLSAEIQPELGGLVRVELLNSMGQTISRQLLRVEATQNGTPGAFTTELAFEIRGDEEAGLLTLTLLDAFYRPLTLRSAQITLGAWGEAQIEPGLEDEPWVTLTEPQPMDIVTGGQLTVGGTIRPLTESPVILELLDETSRVIGSRQVAVESPGTPLNFETTLPYYYIKTFTDARLVVRQNLSPYNSTAILDSLPISVAP